MTLTKAVTGLTALILAAGSSVAVAPAADAAPRAVFSAQGGQLVATATGMRTMVKTCSFDREVKLEADGPLSTFSTDGNMVTAAQVKSSASQVTLRSRKLPPGWYRVLMSCSFQDHGFDRPEVLQEGRVYNK